MSNLIEYAKSELDRIPKDEDGMQDVMNKDILDLIKMFADQGHSGFSASYLISRLQRLMNWKPLSAITGEDNEWYDPSHVVDHMSYQNKRCCSVFKNVYSDGTVKISDIDAVVVSDNGGVSWFTGSICKNFEDPITFPYYPPTNSKHVYIQYTDKDEEHYDVITDQPERIKALREKYLRDRGDLV
jgi:hypothetical protein